MHIGAPVSSLDELEAADLDAPPWPGVIGDDI
jgi:circadian clock protein KaiC